MPASFCWPQCMTAQAGRGAVQVSFGFGALPVGLERFFELAKGPHARVAQVVGEDARSHDVSLSFLTMTVGGWSVSGERCSDSELRGHIVTSLTSAFTGCPIGFAAPLPDRELAHGDSLLITAAGLWPVLTAFPALPRRKREGTKAFAMFKELPDNRKKIAPERQDNKSTHLYVRICYFSLQTSIFASPEGCPSCDTLRGRFII